MRWPLAVMTCRLANGGYAVKPHLTKQIKTYIGISTQVRLQPCGTLKRSEGKACHVFDKRLAS